MLKKLRKHYRVLIATFLFLAVQWMSLASVPAQDVEVHLFIESGLDVEDFLDHDKKIPKGQFVTYLVEVKNRSTTNDYSNLVVLMDVPDHMEYVAQTTSTTGDSFTGSHTQIPDTSVDPLTSPLQSGYLLESLLPSSSHFFYVIYQIDPTLVDDPDYTLAWASVTTQYSAIPIMSNLIETEISGEPSANVFVQVNSAPLAGEQVYPGSRIVYNYQVHNRGGEVAKNTRLTLYTPAETKCMSSNCGLNNIGDLQPNEIRNIVMEVEVDRAIKNVAQIENTGYRLEVEGKSTVNSDVIAHPLFYTAASPTGDFWIELNQSPNVVLSSRDGVTARPDGNDITDTQYTVFHKGRQNYVYPNLSQYGRQETGSKYRCGIHYYNFPLNSYFYAYNSYRNNSRYCGGFSDCWASVVSGPIRFKLTVELPKTAPELINQTTGTPHEIETYFELNSGRVNHFMNKNGRTDQFKISGLNLSRAIKNGAAGRIKGKIRSVGLVEDKWVFKRDKSRDACCTRYYCSLLGYSWQKESNPIVLEADAIIDISALTSTAWLKIEGGHLGTNASITDVLAPGHQSNQVLLGNRSVYTPSSDYTPFDPDQLDGTVIANGQNSDYLIFQQGNNADFNSSNGADYLVNGQLQSQSAPLFLSKGEAYDRSDFPRDYYRDMFDREFYGEVREDQFPSTVRTGLELGDNIIWKNTGNITIGQKGIDDEIIFSGGQARLYTDGDVYINANIKYRDRLVKDSEKLTTLRIDARNIYIAPEVTDVQLLLLARDSFYSGEGNQQLRILGDVIAEKSHWQRKPLLELNPTEFNRPSEHIIEDYRKYIAPPPGDVQPPESRSVWRQVNPATGEVLDAY